MQHGARVWIERYDSRNGAGCARSFDNGTHDQLMAEMQTIKHAEREHGRSLYLCVIGSVEKTHFVIADCQLPIAAF